MRNPRRDATEPLGLSITLLGTALLSTLILLLYGEDISGAQLRHISIMMVTGEVTLGILIAKVDPKGVWGFPFLYFLVLVLFHSGLFLSPAILGEHPTSLTTTDDWWYTSPIIEQSGYIVSVGIACYALGYAITAILSADRTPSFPLADNENAHLSATRSGIVDVGCIVTVASVLTWFWISSASLGPLFFLNPYVDFLGATDGWPLPWIYLGLTIGVTMCALDPGRATAKLGLTVFTLYAVPAFILGLRGEVLFPAVVVIALIGSLRKMPPVRYFAFTCVVTLLAISFVAEARVGGLRSVDTTNVTLGPVEAIEEMGYSVRPVATSVAWHDAGHQPYLSGSSYFAPFDRQLRGVLGLQVPPSSEDARLLNVDIADRVGNIGGSIIAEAHHNWDISGVAAILLGVGIIAGRMFRHDLTPLRMAISGVVAVLLLMHVRNSFTPLPVWGAAGLVLILAGSFLGRLRLRAQINRSYVSKQGGDKGGQEDR